MLFRSTLVRFSKRLGYTGFLDFKKAFLSELLMSAHQAALPPYEELTEADDPPTVLHKVFLLMHESLETSMRRMDQASFTRAVEWMADAGMIEFWAHGGSNHIAQNAAITYLRFGLRCTVYDPLLHAGAIEQTTSRDVVIGVSHTGVTEGVVRAVTRARERGIRAVCLTNTPGSPLASAAEVVLLTSVSSPRLISDAGVSRVAQAAMLDALGVAVVQFLRQRKEIS